MELPTWPYEGSPFHSGERLAQQRAGKREQTEGVGRRVVRGEMLEQHRLFFAQLPFMLAGARTDDGGVWATMLAGTPGFAHALDPLQLRIDAQPLPGDPLDGALRDGAELGLLGIELPTRRRNRLNGVIARRDAAGFTVKVRQSFGNCPRYIQQRELLPVHVPSEDAGVAQPQVLDRLDHEAIALVRRADTLFIASHHSDPEAPHSGGADVSHRGGKPGFVRVDGDDTLVMPDFNGNAYFNTIGNLVASPRAGLLFVDWETGTLLHVAVRAEIVWEGPEVQAYAGAERLVRMRVEQVIRRPGVLPLRGRLVSMSPVLAQTGEWPGNGSANRAANRAANGSAPAADHHRSPADHH